MGQCGDGGGGGGGGDNLDSRSGNISIVEKQSENHEILIFQ